MKIDKEKEIFFIGFLANVDKSSLKLSLENGFKINFVDHEDIDILISKMHMSHSSIFGNVIDHFSFFARPEGSYGTIEKETKDMDNLENLIINYLTPTIRKIRLFKQGNICMPSYLIYTIDNKNPKMLLGQTNILQIQEELFHLEDEDIGKLKKFIEEFDIPSKGYLSLAFESFELSYHVRNDKLSFLSLITALEALFNNPGSDAKQYTIKRNVAVLLGKNKSESQLIFKEIGNLYKKRGIIHGDENVININDIINLRNYIRKSIIKIYNIDKKLKLNDNKKALLDLLHECGYGCKEMDI